MSIFLRHPSLHFFTSPLWLGGIRIQPTFALVRVVRGDESWFINCPLGMFPLFLNRTADVMTPFLSAVFQQLVRLGSFPGCWRQANVTPIPKGPPPSSVANYRAISITSVLSKVFERLVSVHLGRFMEGSSVLPTTQFVYRKGLGT